MSSLPPTNGGICPPQVHFVKRVMSKLNLNKSFQIFRPLHIPTLIHEHMHRHVKVFETYSFSLPTYTTHMFQQPYSKIIKKTNQKQYFNQWFSCCKCLAFQHRNHADLCTSCYPSSLTLKSSSSFFPQCMSPQEAR